MNSQSERIQFLRLLLSVAVDSFDDVNVPADYSTRAYLGCSLLEYALEAQDPEAVGKLIDRGARITNQRNIDELLYELDDNNQNFIEMLKKVR